MTDDLDLTDLDTNDKIVREAHKRFKRCAEWESVARGRWLEDYKFANGDADNRWQWDGDLYTARNRAERPCLTINKTRQHCLQITNEARQNKAAVKISPVGDGATKEAAEVFEGVIRHIEYISTAQDVYDQAAIFQVEGGIGYWRIVTDYVSDDSFDQELFIRPVRDPLNVFLDPDIAQMDGSDMRFGFVFDDVPREIVEAEYPQFKGRAAPQNNVDGDDAGWIREDHIRVCEYYRVEPKTDELIALADGKVFRASDVDPGVVRLAKKDKATKTREISIPKVRWYKIVGDKVVDDRDWPGRYIPIVRVIGEETIVNGELDRKGHVRALKDPQRIYNYWSSAAVECVALQTKSPWIAPVDAIEGVETYWETANRVNHAILPWKHVNDAGQPIPKPERADPPQMPQAFLAGMTTAANEMMMVSGQYQAQMGAPSNERSGIAISERQRQGDNATYHYIDNQATAIRYTGRILLDLIPAVYDTPRVLRILAEDGTEDHVQVDPEAPVAHQVRHGLSDGASAIFNPNVGRYDVEADVGPAFATRRQEAFQAFTQIISQDAGLMPLVGDLMFQAADFPMADEIAERLKRMVPPQALGGPPPQAAQAMQKMQAELTMLQSKLKDQNADREIKVYDAETKRMDVLQDGAALDPNSLRAIVQQLVAETMQTTLEGVAPPTAPQMPGQPQQAPQPPQGPPQ